MAESAVALAAAGSVAGTIISAGSTYASGKFARREGDFRAKQMREQANADKATAVQEAKFERRKSDLLQSRAKALAASSGTDVSSADIQNVMSELDERGEYNALGALFKGFSSARSKLAGANMEEIAGKMEKKQGKRKAIANIVSGSSDFHDVYSYGQGEKWW